MAAVTFMLIAAIATVPGHRVETSVGADGLQVVTSTLQASSSHSLTEPSVPVAGGRSILYRAQQLWVDRNHQSAIANESSIGGAGQVVFTSWYLNNDRLSRYVTCGGGEPLWSFEALDNSAEMDVAAGTAGAMSACSPQIGTLAWTDPGSSPDISAPGAVAQDLCESAGILACVAADGMVTCLDAANGDQLWQASLQTTGNGINGAAVSGDGSRVLVTVYDSSQGVHVFDAGDGAPVGTPFGNYSQTAAAISDDGNRIVTGDFNGRVRLWEYDGSDWNQQGSFVTGDSWVTAVAISGDGQTAVGGTLAFNPYGGRVVAYDWPSSGSPTEMWQYDQYGDEVSSVDVSGDGEVIIAGSWGRYQGTFGDVVTVLDGTGAVILQIQDDIDEPGSIFSVAVSDDGQWATASGKAVHAREMGSGGQVYALQISAAADNDVAVSDIISPVENQQVGNSLTPEVSVSNLGSSSASFPVYASISDGGSAVWDDTVNVSGLAPGSSTQIGFSEWTVPGYGSWTFTAAADLVGDGFPANDSLSGGIRAMHDAAADAILRPYQENTVLMPFAPLATVHNSGTYDEVIDATLTLSSGGGTVYQETVSSQQLSPGESAQCQFPQWNPAETGAYSACLAVAVTDDYVSGNDSLETDCTVVWEMIYEDGSWESYYWVGSQDEDMFAVRYTPVVDPPYGVDGARIYVNSTEPFQWAAICPDDGTGLPDVANPLQFFEELSVPSAPAWLEIPFQATVEEQGDIWLVSRWPDAKALAVGTDTDEPLEGRSWWHNRDNGWVHFTTGDFAFRITLDPETGCEGPERPQVVQVGLPAPNPASAALAIPVGVPSGGAYLEAGVFDLSGRLVARPARAEYAGGNHDLQWNLRTSGGDPVPCGMYIIRVAGGGTTAHRKVLVIR